MSDPLPPRDEWNRSVAHSRENPEHILGPYEGSDGRQHVDCTCGWTTEQTAQDRVRAAIEHDRGILEAFGDE